MNQIQLQNKLFTKEDFGLILALEISLSLSPDWSVLCHFEPENLTEADTVALDRRVGTFVYKENNNIITKVDFTLKGLWSFVQHHNIK